LNSAVFRRFFSKLVHLCLHVFEIKNKFIKFVWENKEFLFALDLMLVNIFELGFKVLTRNFSGFFGKQRFFF